MTPIIIETLNSFILQVQAQSELIGISPEHMTRVYCPEFTLSNLPAGAAYLAVFLQDCTVDTEEVRCGVMKTISFRIGVIKKVLSIETTEIDPVVAIFEKLQNFLTGFRDWSCGGRVCTLTKVTPSGIVDPDTLTQYLVADCGFDVEIQTFVAYT